jgi:hypothetical protein
MYAMNDSYFNGSSIRSSNFNSSDGGYNKRLSRFMEDFNEISNIGKGHFGKVVRA